MCWSAEVAIVLNAGAAPERGIVTYTVLSGEVGGQRSADKFVAILWQFHPENSQGASYEAVRGQCISSFRGYPNFRTHRGLQ